MTGHRIVHRYIQSTAKHQAKTACGILLFAFVGDGAALDEFGSEIVISRKGQAFDCKRCTAVIENFRKGRISA